MEDQARGAAAKKGQAELGSVTADGEPARAGQIATDRYASLPPQADGATTERHALHAARQRARTPEKAS